MCLSVAIALQTARDRIDMSAEEATIAQKEEEALAEITASVEEIMIKDDDRYVSFVYSLASQHATGRIRGVTVAWRRWRS